MLATVAVFAELFGDHLWVGRYHTFEDDLARIVEEPNSSLLE